MEKKNQKLPFIPVIILCLILAAGACFLIMRTVRLHQETRQMDEQFEKELEESRKTIDQLKKQEAEIDTDISHAEEEKKELNPTPSPTPEPILVSILNCQPGEVLSGEALYLDNPGIYFTAAQISEGDEVDQRIRDSQIQESSDALLSQLRYLKMPYYNQNGEIVVGEMVVNKEISGNVLDAFLELFQEKQQLPSMNLEENIWVKSEDWAELKSKFHLTAQDPEELEEPENTVETKPAENIEEADAVFVEE